MFDSVTVNVAGKAHVYALDIAGYGDFIANGGSVSNLRDFVAGAKRTIKSADWVTAVTGWVILDDAPLAYHIEVTGSGAYKIVAAAPLGGTALRAEYDA